MNNLEKENSYDFIARYLSYKYWIMGFVIICLGISFIYLRSVEPEYRITALATLKPDPVSTVKLNQAVQRLRSDELIKKTLDQLLIASKAEQYRLNLVITVGNQQKGSVIFSLLETDRKTGIRFLNQLVKNYNSENKGNDRIQAITYTQLNDSLTAINDQLVVLNQKLAALKQNAVVTKPTPVHKQISENNNLQLKLFEVIIPYLQNPDKQFSLVPYSDELKDRELQDLIIGFNRIQTEKQARPKYLPANDPVTKNLDQNLIDLHNSIAERIETLKAAILEPPVITKIKPSGKITAIVDTAIQLKTIEKIKLTNELNQVNYKPSQNSSLIIIDQPSSPPYPEYPKKGFVYVLALLIGLLLPGCILLAMPGLKNANTGLSGRVNELQKLIHLPIYEAYNLSDPQSSGAANALPFILKHLDAHNGAQTLLITAVDNDGLQSRLSKSLALNFADTGKKTVLVDCNFRESTISKKFGLDDMPGIINFLHGEREIEKIILPTDNKYLHIVGIGVFKNTADPVISFFNNNELLSPWEDENKLDAFINSPLIGKLIERLKTKFDYIILDAPSISYPADIFPLVRFAGLEIIALKQGPNVKARAKTIEMYRQKKRFNNAVLFNFT